MEKLGDGKIVNIGSFSWMLGQGNMPAYTTAKSAVMGLTRTIARDLGKFNIRVNCVSPGPIYFEGGVWQMLKDTMAKWFSKVEKDHPSGRLGTPEEVSNCVIFISSPAASWVSGTNLIVDGGFTKRVQF